MKKSQPPSSENYPELLRILTLTGSDFLHGFCNYARDRIGANTAFVSSLGLIEAEYIFVEAMSDGAGPRKMLEVQTTPTPCHKVLKSGQPYFVCKDVRGTYPEAKVIELFGSQAYLGLPLKQADGGTIGLVELEWSRPTEHIEMEQAIEELTPLLRRVAEELMRMSLKHVLPALINPTTPATPDDHIEVFRTIAAQAAEITKVHSVWIVFRNGKGAMKYRILAANCEGKNAPEREGELGEYYGIPCSNMIEKDIHFEASDVRKNYPDMPFLERLCTESYLGFGFRNTEGETIGHIAFLHNRPMRSEVKDCKIIRVLASRVGQELQRYVLERQKEELGAALRVRSKLESLGTMAATIAHDFNNQLTAILGNTEIAALELEESHPSKKFLVNAEQSIWRARDVVAELMDFAGNSTNAPPEHLDLREIAASAIGEFQSRLTTESRIVLDVHPNIPEIKSRRIRVFQIISNLISNALDASVPGVVNEIRVSIYLTRMSDDERARCLSGKCFDLPEQSICIEVRDSGRGMDVEEAERIFDPYFSSKGINRGLGLSSVLGIAKRLEVGMTLESKVGSGTAFRLYFRPIIQMTDSEDIKETLTLAPAESKVALVVDDEDSVNSFISKALASEGWDVKTVFSGEEAIKLASSTEAIDLVFVDVVMPGINGFETLDELRSIHPNILAVMISGYNEEQLSEPLRYDKSVAFLAKPFGLQAIRDTIDELIPAS